VTIILVLAHATDAGAASVAAWLAREHGAEAVRTLRPEVLSLARWSQHIDPHGRSSARLAPATAQPLADAEVGAVLHRICYLPMPAFSRATAKDRDYAAAELQAVVAGWLAGFGDRAIHSLRRHPWVTPTLPLQRWAKAAVACGLPVAGRTIASSPRARVAGNDADPAGWPPAGTVLVAGSGVGGPLADEYGARCLAAARLLDLPLLEFCFAVEDRGRRLVQVDPMPPLVEPWSVALVGRLLGSHLRAPGP
jgi:hypothetical protein